MGTQSSWTTTSAQVTKTFFLSHFRAPAGFKITGPGEDMGTRGNGAGDLGTRGMGRWEWDMGTSGGTGQHDF